MTERERFLATMRYQDWDRHIWGRDTNLCPMEVSLATLPPE